MDSEDLLDLLWTHLINELKVLHCPLLWELEVRIEILEFWIKLLLLELDIHHFEFRHWSTIYLRDLFLFFVDGVSRLWLALLLYSCLKVFLILWLLIMRGWILQMESILLGFLLNLAQLFFLHGFGIDFDFFLCLCVGMVLMLLMLWLVVVL